MQRTLQKHGIVTLRRCAPSVRDTALKPIVDAPADVRAFHLEPRSFRTEFGGLFLFIPDLMRRDLDRIVADSDLPGSTRLPAAHLVRALLALTRWGIGRPAHIMPDILDPGLAVFAGLNVCPTRSSLTEYTGQADPKPCTGLMDRWYRALNGLETDLARDAEVHVLVYAHARVRKADHNDEILRVIQFGEDRNAALPREVVCDSRLTTHANLWTIHQRAIDFLAETRRFPPRQHRSGPP